MERSLRLSCRCPAVQRKRVEIQKILEQYEKRAVQLLESPCGNGIKGYKTKDGLICRYDSKKNDFAKGSPEKGVRTMFKPDDGEEYYRRRLEAEGIENDE